MRMKKIPVRMLAILLVCMTVLLSVCLELLSVPAMAAEEKAACYTVRIAHVEHGSIALKEDDNLHEYYGAAEPPVRCGESHLSGLTEPPHFVY